MGLPKGGSYVWHKPGPTQPRHGPEIIFRSDVEEKTTVFAWIDLERMVEKCYLDACAQEFPKSILFFIIGTTFLFLGMQDYMEVGGFSSNSRPV